MEATMEKSPAARVRRSFKAGRPQKADQQLSGLTAVGIATQHLKDLRERMTDEGLLAEHAVAWLVLTHPVTGPERLFITPSRVQERIELLMHADTQPLGIVFGQYNPDDPKGARKYFWSKHFLTDPESRRVVEAVRQTCIAEAALKNWN